MVKSLTEKEVQVLQKYRLKPGFKHVVRVADLMDEMYLRKFMTNLSEMIGAPSEKVAASIFIKRYAFVAVIVLYAMSVWNKKINVNLDLIDMEVPEQGKNWLPSIHLKDLTAEEFDLSSRDRAEWRQEVIKDLFANNIYPIIAKLEKTFGISKLILWENIAVYLFWLYETELKTNNKQAVDDFNYIIFESDGSLFGQYKGNPLQKYYGKKTFVEQWGEEVRMRKTCCFTYQLEGSTKRCKTCPCAHLSKDGGCTNGDQDICNSGQGLA